MVMEDLAVDMEGVMIEEIEIIEAADEDMVTEITTMA